MSKVFNWYFDLPGLLSTDSRLINVSIEWVFFVFEADLIFSNIIFDISAEYLKILPNLTFRITTV